MKSREASALAMSRVLLHSAGEVVLCENKHPIAVLSRDLYRGDADYATALSYVPGQRPAVKGDLYPLRCSQCNGAWFNGPRRTFQTKPLWTS